MLQGHGPVRDRAVVFLQALRDERAVSDTVSFRGNKISNRVPFPMIPVLPDSYAREGQYLAGKEETAAIGLAPLGKKRILPGIRNSFAIVLDDDRTAVRCGYDS